MKRYIQKVFAALLCACLVGTCAPLPVLADEGPEPSVGSMGWFSSSGQASTTVNVLAVPSIELAITADYAAGIREIAANPAKFDPSVEVVKGTGPFTYQWYRAELDAEGNPGESVALDGETSATYPLSQHTDTLAYDASYRFTVRVTDAEQHEEEASVVVTVTDGYDERTLPDGATLPRVHGLSIHEAAELAASAVDERSASYGFLQQAASGMKLDGSAWQLSLVGAPAGKDAFVGELSVTLAVSPEAVEAGAEAVRVVGLLPDGSTAVYDAKVDAGTATFKADALGVFAVAYPVAPDKSFLIEATAGAGGSITPEGTTTYAQGATAVYTVLPDAGYAVDSVTVDGKAAALAGNTYTFENVQAKHAIAVTFVKLDPPVDPQQTHLVRAQVQGADGQGGSAGGNGLVGIDGGEPAALVEARVLENGSAAVQFVPDDGYVVKSVTVQKGEDAPEPVNVFGLTYLIPAVTADMVVTVEYGEGIAPPVPTHEVTAVAGEGGRVEPATQTVSHAGSATVSVFPNDGFRIATVLVNGVDRTGDVSSTGALTLQNIVRDVRVQATFEAIPRVVAVTATAGEGGTVSPEGRQELEAGSSTTYYFYADKGFELDTVTLTGLDGASRDVTGQVRGGVLQLADIQEDLELAATFRALSVQPPEDTYYVVTASAGKGGSVSPDGATRLKAGASQTFYFMPDEGYVLDSVKVDGRAVEVSGFSYTLANISANAKVEVSFAAVDPDDPDAPDVPVVPEAFEITAAAGAGGAISPSGAVPVLAHGSMAFSFIPDAGFELDAVTVDGKTLAADDPALADGSYRFDDVTGPHAIAAAFKAKQTTPEEPAYVMLTTKVSAGQGTVTPAGSTRVTRGVQQWVYFNPAEGFKLESVTVQRGEGAAEDVTTSVDGGALDLGALEADTTVTAAFAEGSAPEIKRHVVTASASAGGVVSPEGALEVADGGSLSFSFTPLAGYEFVQALVTRDGHTATVADRTYMLENIVSDCTVSAQFRKQAVDEDVYYTVTASASEGGSISPEGSTRVAAGRSTMLYFYPDKGYKLANVLVNGEKAEPQGLALALLSVTGDTTVRAEFEALGQEEQPPAVPESFDLTATATAGGTVSPAGTTRVQAGGQMLYTFTPDAGYVLTRVEVDGNDATDDVAGNAYRFVGVGAAHTVHAVFEKDAQVPDPLARHTVHASVAGNRGGIVSPDDDVTVPAGSSVSFNFLPEKGYRVAKLRIGDGEPFAYAANSCVLAGVSGDTSLEVTFEAEPDAPGVPDEQRFAATATVTGEGRGSVSPERATVLQGGSLLFTFTPDEGYQLASVTDNGADVTDRVSAAGAYRMTNVQEEHAVEVAFASIPVDGSVYHMVTAQAEGDGFISPEGNTRVAAGGSQTFTLRPGEGSKLASLLVRSAGDPTGVESIGGVDKTTGTFVLNDVQGDVSILAVFEKLDPGEPEPPALPSVHPVTATCTSGGAVSPSGTVQAAEGSTVQFAFAPDAGFRLASATVNGQKASVENNLLSLAVGDAPSYAVHAVFERVPVVEDAYYQVIASVEGDGGAVSPAGATRVKAGESQTLWFFPDDGRTLASVTVDGQPVTVEGFSYTLFDIAQDARVIATFRPLDQGEEPPMVPVQYTVRASASAGGLVSPSEATAAAGSTPLFTFAPDAGYHVASVTVDGSMDVTGQAAGGTYRFAPLDGDHTLDVTFEAEASAPVEPAYYQVTARVDGDGGTVIPVGANRVAAGGSQTFSFVPQAGYAVDRVSVNGSSFAFSGTSYTLFGVEADTTLTVSFKEDPTAPEVKTHTVTASASAGGSISPEGSLTVASGADLSFTLTAFEGYELYRVAVDEGTDAERIVEPSELSNGQFRLAGITGDHAVRALYKKAGTDPVDPSDPDKPAAKVALSATAGPNGSVSPSGTIEVPVGSSQTFAFHPDEGYEVDEVLVDNAKVEKASSYTFSDVQVGHTLHVTFAKIADKPEPEPDPMATVHASAGEGGSISPAGELRLPAGSTQTFYFLPDPGKRVESLTVDGRAFPYGGSSYTMVGIVDGASIAVTFVDRDPDDPTPVPEIRTVTATAGEHGSVSPSGEVVVVKGGAMLFAFTPDEGYEVDEVSVNGAVVRQGGTTYRLTDVMDDAALHVTFKPKEMSPSEIPVVDVAVEVKVQVGTEQNAGGMVSPSGDMKLAKGARQSFYIFPEEGYVLDKLLVNGVETEAEPLSGAMFRSARAAAGAAGGYRFVMNDVTDDVRIEVQFRPLNPGEPAPAPVTTHQVTVSGTEGGMISPEGDLRVVHGGSMSLTVKPEPGWHLASLMAGTEDVADQVHGGVFELSSVSDDVTVRASFEADGADPQPKPFVTIHTKSSEGGSIEPSGDVRVKTGESQTFAFLPDEGYVLDSAAVNGRAVAPIDGMYTIYDVAEDAVLEAVFRSKLPDDPNPPEPLVHEVAASVEGAGGSVEPASAKVSDGGSLLFTFAPDDGYELDRVLLDGDWDVTDQVKDLTFLLTGIVEPHRLTVSFKPATVEPEERYFTVKAEAGEHGTVSPTELRVKEGESATFAFAPDEGYEVDQVMVNGHAVENASTSFTLFNVRAETRLLVTFKEIGKPPKPPTRYKVSAGASEGGSIDPSGIVEVDEGDSLTFRIKADAGYVLESLVVNKANVTDSVIDGSYTLNDIRNDATVYASFTKKGVPPVTRYVIEAGVSGGHGTVSPSGAVEVAAGADQTFYLYHDEGYEVDVLIVDGQRLSWKTDRYTFANIRENHSLVVSYKPVAVPGNPTANPMKALVRNAITKTGDRTGPLAVGLVAVLVGAAVIVHAAHRRMGKQRMERIRRR